MKFDLYGVISLKHYSTGKYVAPFGYSILILIQPVFVLTPYCREAATTNFIVFGLTIRKLEPTSYRSLVEHMITITPPMPSRMYFKLILSATVVFNKHQ